MKKLRLLGAVCACLATVTINANASIFNTLNGTNYEWLELTAMTNVSRNSVQALIDTAAPGDTLYGYEYASRVLVEDLYYSYIVSWDGLNGLHGASSAVTGIAAFLSDFG